MKKLSTFIVISLFFNIHAYATTCDNTLELYNATTGELPGECSIIKSSFNENFNFQNHSLQGSYLTRDSSFYNITATSSNLSNTTIEAVIKNSNFDQANFQNASIDNAIFDNVSFRGADFRGTQFENFTPFYGTTNLEGAIYSNFTQLPKGWTDETAKKHGMVYYHCDNKNDFDSCFILPTVPNSKALRALNNEEAFNRDAPPPVVTEETPYAGDTTNENSTKASQ